MGLVIMMWTSRLLKTRLSHGPSLWAPQQMSDIRYVIPYAMYDLQGLLLPEPTSAPPVSHARAQCGTCCSSASSAMLLQRAYCRMAEGCLSYWIERVCVLAAGVWS